MTTIFNENGATSIYFFLKEEFINNFKWKQPKWGPIGYVTYKRTYARELPTGKSEEYWQTVRRVVEGVFTIQKRHCYLNNLPWSEAKARRSAEKMYQLMWDFKFTPPGRGLWMMGTPAMYDKGVASLLNCAFISTENINVDFAEPFTFMMDMSMLGVGVGSDTRGAGKITIRQPKESDENFIVEDTREGWVDLLRTLLNAFIGKNPLPTSIDYSRVRPAGSIIKGFGGTASGPGPLIEMYDNIKNLLLKEVGNKISVTTIVDIHNFIGRCVVSGNIRRSAQIIFGEPTNEEFLDLKNPETHKEELMNRRWASNNSVFATIGMDYSKVASMTAKNGEPGYIWLDSIRKYSRINGEVNNKDYRCMGANPCAEQGLEDRESCNLSESFPVNHDSLEDWIETLKYAYMYSKTVTLLPSHNKLNNSVMMKNRRIGLSVSGIVQSFKKFGRKQSLMSFDKGYDKIQEWDKTYSDWLCIPRSIKTTTVKPSGTTSLLPGVTPGIHYPISEYYIRNVRFQEGSKLLDELKESGYKVEKDKYSLNTYVVSFPVKESYFDRSVNQVSMWEQLENAADLQKYWSDNAVSVTISFSEDEKKDISKALEVFEDRLKGVSFLPKTDHGYEQAPYIPITKEEYEEMVDNLEKVRIKDVVHDQTEKFCDGDACEIDPVKK